MNVNRKTGYLEVLVLDALNAESRSGYELMALLEKKLGNKPSPGSIYPLLSRMYSEKLVSVAVKGRRKIYSLTSAGKKVLAEKMKEKESMISHHADLFRSMLKENFYIKSPFFKMIHYGKMARKLSPETAKQLLELRDEVAELIFSENYVKNEKAFNREISSLTTKIKKLNSQSIKQNK